MDALIGKTTAEIEAALTATGQPAYRGRQIARWIYRRGADSVQTMTDLPQDLRGTLAGRFTAGLPAVTARDAAPDGAVKYLLRLEDGEEVEAVYLPYEDRVSVCLSSQVGCAAGCTFCATALGGLARNLTAGEIAGQLVRLQAENPARRISHCVYMGMGEPLMNYDEVLRSVRLLTGPREVGLSPRHITISTVGVAPGIMRLAEDCTGGLPITLALSLHAPDDALRERLVPTARKWKLDEILGACRVYHERTRRNLTFEYLLIAGVNDAPEQAAAVAERLRGLPGNVNLIPFNYVETQEGFRRPSTERVAAFRAVLEAAGRVTTQRMERGHAISAACGQLRRTAGTLRPRIRSAAVLPSQTAGAGAVAHDRPLAVR